jgi:hypothetical protein
MKPLLLMVAMVLVGWNARAQIITLTEATNNLYDTGLDSTGAALAVNAADPHYTLIADAGGAGTTAYALGTFDGIASSTGTTPPSRWISYSTTASGPTGIYDYQLSLTNIPVGVLVSISGQILADDSVTINADGTLSYTGPANGYTTYHAFSFNFTADGSDNLDFSVSNSGGGPTALEVNDLAGSYPVPETKLTGLWCLLFAGGLMALARTRRLLNA